MIMSLSPRFGRLPKTSVRWQASISIALALCCTATVAAGNTNHLGGERFAGITSEERQDLLITETGLVVLGEQGDSFVSVLPAQEEGYLVAGSRLGETGGRLVLIEVGLASDGSHAQVERLGPRAKSEFSQSSPRLTGSEEPGSFAIAWFEGTSKRDNRVWFAEGGANGFSRPQQLAGPALGSQVGLNAVTLNDGRQIVLWSAFDGNDTELLWVIKSNGVWSRPQRLAPNNEVPDIGPSLIAQGNSAIVAWSWFDGTSYRLVTATFSGNAWGAPGIASPNPAAFPEFVAGAQTPTMTYFDYRADSWSFLQLDAHGAPDRVALAPEFKQRPVARSIGPDTIDVVLVDRSTAPAGPIAGHMSGQMPEQTTEFNTAPQGADAANSFRSLVVKSLALKSP